MEEEKIIIKKERPKDYHCICEYCSNFYRGELLKSNGKYFSGRTRIGYSPLEKKIKHLCPGNPIGYRFMIENYSNVADIIFDPTVGSGTALVEAAKLNRYGIGIELEFFNILKENIKPYPSLIKIYEGDARKKIDEIDSPVNLILNGPSYQGKKDAPERSKNWGPNRIDNSFSYKDQKNFSFLPEKEYYSELISFYKECVKKLLPGGYFAFIIKDLVKNKKPVLLHYILARLIESPELQVKDVYIHRHYPPTMFMNTYPKRFPNVKIPLYQTIIILQKISHSIPQLNSQTLSRREAVSSKTYG